MARIRSIKPEFWTSEQVAELSPITRLLFIGLWNFCDDAGVHPASSRTLKMEVFPGDDFTTSQISEMVSELLNSSLLAEFQANDGKNYWYVTGWAAHQKVEKPNFKHPKPPKFADHSPTTRRPLDDHSTPEGSGREGKGKEGKGKEGRGLAPARPHEGNPINPLPHSVEPPPPPHDQQAGGGGADPEQPTDEYTRCYQAILDWGKQDNWAALRKIADDAHFIGNVQNEVVRFVTHNLAKDNYRQKLTSNPVKFLREQLPGWLRLPAAGKNTARNGQNRPANQKATHPTTTDEAQILIQAKHPNIASLFTEGQIKRLANAPNESTFHEWAEQMAKNIHNGAHVPRSNATEVNIQSLLTL